MNQQDETQGREGYSTQHQTIQGVSPQGLPQAERLRYRLSLHSHSLRSTIGQMLILLDCLRHEVPNDRTTSHSADGTLACQMYLSDTASTLMNLYATLRDAEDTFAQLRRLVQRHNADRSSSSASISAEPIQMEFDFYGPVPSE